MSDCKYDFIVVGRWRNRALVEETLRALRTAGKKVYCFIENEYEGDGIKFETHAKADAEKMVSETESLPNWQANQTFRRIYEADMAGMRESESLVIVFPSGLSAHMELGVAFGMGKKCYAVGQPEKAETLYLMFDEIFRGTKSLVEQLA